MDGIDRRRYKIPITRNVKVHMTSGHVRLAPTIFEPCSFAHFSPTEIPFFNRPLTVTSHGSPAWAYSYRIDVGDNANRESFFMKMSFAVSLGDHGREALKGEFESTAAIHAVVGNLSSELIGWGSFKAQPEAHYYFCRFHELSDELPEPDEFCKGVATLHRKNKAPNGKFGFHVTTYNGDLPQDNSYTDTWEQFFINGFKHVIKLNIIRGGPWAARVYAATPSTHFGHRNPSAKTNIDELGNWRPERNKFSKRYFNTYHSYVPKSAPGKDYDDRNALYCLRINLQAAALFPMVIDEMQRLVLKYPRGYEEYLDKLS
ncbi:hypothetical protein BDV10DRAFT_199696 [Aspergillus recurvatus]